MVILIGMTHRVGVKGQVVIPKELRDRAGIRPGDDVHFEAIAGGVVVRPAARARLGRGALAGAGLTAALVAERAREQR